MKEIKCKKCGSNRKLDIEILNECFKIIMKQRNGKTDTKVEHLLQQDEKNLDKIITEKNYLKSDFFYFRFRCHACKYEWAEMKGKKMKKLILWVIEKDGSEGQKKTVTFSNAEKLRQKLEIIDDEIPYRKFYYLLLKDFDIGLTETEKEILKTFFSPFRQVIPNHVFIVNR